MTRRLFALRPDARLRRVPRARAVQPHPGLDRSRGRPHLLHGAGRARRAARVPGHVRQASPAASAPAWRATPCTATASTTSPGTGCGSTSTCPSTAEWKAAGVKLDDGDRLSRGRDGDVEAELAAAEGLHAGAAPARAGPARASRCRSTARPLAELPPPGSYVEIKRTWQERRRRSRSTLPKTLRLEPLPDNPRRAAILWGPLVLAGDLGPEDGLRRPGSPAAVPVLVAAERPVADGCKPCRASPAVSARDGVGRDSDVDFVPFYRLHRRTYAVYWDLFTPPEWEKNGRSTPPSASGSASWSGHGGLRPARRDAARARLQHAGRGHRSRTGVQGRPCRRGTQVVLVRPAGGAERARWRWS